MVALSFITAANRQEASVEHFTFDTIDELQEHLNFVWRNLYTNFAPRHQPFWPVRFSGSAMLSDSDSGEDDTCGYAGNDHDNNNNGESDADAHDDDDDDGCSVATNTDDDDTNTYEDDDNEHINQNDDGDNNQMVIMKMMMIISIMIDMVIGIITVMIIWNTVITIIPIVTFS